MLLACGTAITAHIMKSFDLAPRCPADNIACPSHMPCEICALPIKLVCATNSLQAGALCVSWSSSKDFESAHAGCRAELGLPASCLQRRFCAPFLPPELQQTSFADLSSSVQPIIGYALQSRQLRGPRSVGGDWLAKPILQSSSILSCCGVGQKQAQSSVVGRRREAAETYLV